MIVVDDTGFAEDAQYVGYTELEGCIADWDDVVWWCLAPDDASESTGVWQTGRQKVPGTYIVLVQFSPDLDPTPEKLQWTSSGWELYDEPFDFDGARILGRVPMMEVSTQTETPLNQSCKTGMSPSGHCAAAAVCGEDCDCCMNCDKACNLRCGWPDA